MALLLIFFHNSLSLKEVYKDDPLEAFSSLSWHTPKETSPTLIQKKYDNRDRYDPPFGIFKIFPREGWVVSPDGFKSDQQQPGELLPPAWL